MNKEMEALNYIKSLVAKKRMTLPQHAHAQEALQLLQKAIEPKEGEKE